MGGVGGGAEDVKKPMFKTNWLTLLLKLFPHINPTALETTRTNRGLENKREEQVLLETKHEFTKEENQ